MWCKYVVSVSLFYTRSTQGQVELLKAKGKALSMPVLDKPERVKVWK